MPSVTLETEDIPDTSPIPSDTASQIITYSPQFPEIVEHCSCCHGHTGHSGQISIDAKYPPNVVLMFGQRLRRWPTSKQHWIIGSCLSGYDGLLIASSRNGRPSHNSRTQC